MTKQGPEHPKRGWQWLSSDPAPQGWGCRKLGGDAGVWEGDPGGQADTKKSWKGHKWPWKGHKWPWKGTQTPGGEHGGVAAQVYREGSRHAGGAQAAQEG